MHINKVHGSDPIKDFDSSWDSYDHGSCQPIITTTQLQERKQATSAYRRELGLASLIVPTYSVSPSSPPINYSELASRPGRLGPSKKTLNLP